MWNVCTKIHRKIAFSATEIQSPARHGRFPIESIIFNHTQQRHRFPLWSWSHTLTTQLNYVKIKNEKKGCHVLPKIPALLSRYAGLGVSSLSGRRSPRIDVYPRKCKRTSSLRCRGISVWFSVLLHPFSILTSVCIHDPWLSTLIKLFPKPHRSVCPPSWRLGCTGRIFRTSDRDPIHNCDSDKWHL